MRSSPAVVERALLLIFAAVVASFIAATAYSQYRAQTIDERARQIAAEVSPAIERLTAIRTDVRRLQATALTYVEAPAPARSAALGELNHERQTLDDDVKLYLQLPLQPDVRRRWHETAMARLGDLKYSVLRVTDQLQSGEPEAPSRAMRDVTIASDAASAAVLQDLDLTSSLARDLALRIEHTREQAAILVWTLDLLCTLTAALGVLVVIRVHRQHAALAEAHSKLLEHRNHELEEFSGRVAHDILSPLTSIGLTLSAIDRKLEEVENPALAAMTARGVRSLHKVETIVAGLLDFARAGAPPETGAQTDVKRVIDDVLATCGPSAARAFTKLACEPFESCTVRCNPGVLTSLISNLVENAIKYMGDSPVRRITVRVATECSPVIRFEVRDTGPGIPSELAPSVFSPYIRGAGNRRPGIGLGLATVKRMAEAHGGAVGVESSLGRGSVFWFELPGNVAEGARTTERAPGNDGAVSPALSQEVARPS